MQKYSIFSLIKNAFSNHEKWDLAFRIGGDVSVSTSGIGADWAAYLSVSLNF